MIKFCDNCINLLDKLINFLFHIWVWVWKNLSYGKKLHLVYSSSQMRQHDNFAYSFHPSLLLEVLFAVYNLLLQRLCSPVHEAFSYGMGHISLWFNEVWPYASLNHNGICRIPCHIPYENASRTGLRTQSLFCVRFPSFKLMNVIYNHLEIAIKKRKTSTTFTWFHFLGGGEP